MNAMEAIYDELYDTYIVDKGIVFEEYIKKLSQAIKKILEKIKLCVVVTGKEKDAYTLFEVLNDRNFPVEDLELIKTCFISGIAITRTMNTVRMNILSRQTSCG